MAGKSQKRPLFAPDLKRQEVKRIVDRSLKKLVPITGGVTTQESVQSPLLIYLEMYPH